MHTDFNIVRDENGIPHINAASEQAMYHAQGVAHATDRGMQMLLMRILGQGRLAEYLDPTENGIKIDHFFKRMNWVGNSGQQIENLSDFSKKRLQAYCNGVNQVFSKHYPLEMKLLGYKPDIWTSDDSILISRMVGYLTLAQSQGEIERLVIEMIQANISDEKLEALFPNLLNECDRDLINKIKLDERIVPNDVLWAAGVPRMMASNNWVVSGSKTKSGQPILSNDPHLEVNRLPNVWCEMAIAYKNENEDKKSLGSTMPGIPGVLIGRNEHLAWGATYAFVDTIDSWIEKCDNGKYYREDNNQWIDFVERKDTINVTGKSSVEVIFYENDLGTLEGNPFKQEYNLITRWVAADSGTQSVEAVFDLFHEKCVQDGMSTYGKIETGWNYIFADSKGDIGYQMSGKVPVRREGLSGLIPYPAWKKENHWQGFIAVKDMPNSFNPESGFFCTANENLNQYGNASPINLPMGTYRSDRIAELLNKKNDFTIEDMCKMHFDVYSKQAALYMEVLRPLLPNTEQGNILKGWDLCYSKNSKGAYLFEQFYKALYVEVFGKQGFGENVCHFLQKESGTFIDFYDNFDNILLSEKSVWFSGESQEIIFKRVAEKSLNTSIKEWQQVQKYTMKNILFDGKLPKLLGFDKGPLTAIGGRATIHQGQIYRAGGRDTTFLPSYRMVTDFKEFSLKTNLAGGPSDRRFSKWYTSDLQNWLDGKYKTILPTINKKLPFP